MSPLAQKREAALSALINGAGTRVTSSTLLPASDYFDLAGEEFGRRLLLTEGVDGTQYCLRPDFTLPIAQTYIAEGHAQPAAIAYRGPVFRQRNTGPTEFEQAGLELLAQSNAEIALHKVFEFSKAALAIFDVAPPTIRYGSVALFEALLAVADMPAVWKPRIRRRFGNTSALMALLDRLANPHETAEEQVVPRPQLIQQITQTMLEDGLPKFEGRKPEDIADRFLEKQALAAAKVPDATIALLHNYLQISGSPTQAVEQIEQVLKTADISMAAQLQDLIAHASALENCFPKSQMRFEACFSPRLHYYTGLVFELQNEENKTLVSGGQYDRLLQALGSKEKISASGCSIWVKRVEQAGAK